MVLDIKASIFTTNKNSASLIREKLQKHGIEVLYISKLTDFMPHLIVANREILFIDAKYSRIRESVTDFHLRYDNNNVIVYFGESDHCENLGLNSYSINLSSIDTILPMIIENFGSVTNIYTSIPMDMLYGSVTELLDKFKIPPRLKGYNYILQAVIFAVKNVDNGCCKEIYRRVARDNHKSPASVEKNIRSAIEKAIYSDRELFKEIGLYEKKVTNSVFINYLTVQSRLNFFGSSHSKK